MLADHETGDDACALTKVLKIMNYLGDQAPRRSPNRRYRWRGRTWYQDQCVPGYQSQSCRYHWSCLSSTRTPRLWAPLEDLLCLGSSNSAVNCNLFVTMDTEWTHRVPSLGENWLLTSQLLQHLEILKIMVNKSRNGFEDVCLPWLLASICHQIHQRRC